METGNLNPKKGKPKTSWGCLIVFMVIVALLFGSLTIPIPPYCPPLSNRGYIITNIDHARKLVLAIKVYASEQGGGYPDDLGKLVRADILTKENLKKFSHIKLDGGRPDAEWIYVRGLNDSSPNDRALIVSPALKSTVGSIARLWNQISGGIVLPTEESRIFGLNDGSVMKMREAKFQEYLQKTGQTLPALPPANSK